MLVNALRIAYDGESRELQGPHAPLRHRTRYTNRATAMGQGFFAAPSTHRTEPGPIMLQMTRGRPSLLRMSAMPTPRGLLPRVGSQVANAVPMRISSQTIGKTPLRLHPSTAQPALPKRSVYRCPHRVGQYTTFHDLPTFASHCPLGHGQSTMSARQRYRSITWVFW
jgi:hypothetical protein